MPFSGGGGGQLSNHVHDNTPLQGGPLNFSNVTIGGMSQGDLTFSDGAALQTLAAPGIPNNEVLTFQTAATAPSWQAGGAKSLVGSTVLGANANTISVSFTSINQSDIGYLQAVLNCKKTGNSAAIFMQINGYTGSDYTHVQNDIHYTTQTITNGYTDSIPIHSGSRGQDVFVVADIASNDVDDKPIIYFEAVSDDRNISSGSGVYHPAGVTSFNQVRFFTTPQEFTAGSELLIYRINS